MTLTLLLCIFVASTLLVCFGMAGKILQDATTIGQHNIKEKDFLVVMVTKVSCRENTRLCGRIRP